MKRRTFLGKPVPRVHQVPGNWKGRQSPLRLAPILLLAVAVGGFIHASLTANANTPPSLQRSFGTVTRVFADDSKPTVTVPIDTSAPKDPTNPDFQTCNFQKIFVDSNGNILRTSFFPFIPLELTASPAAYTIVTDAGKTLDYNPCSSTYWTKQVIFYFIIKILAVLNWLAGAAAIILTVYAGILYMTGFASEENVKKAKAILIGAYAGLIIVFLARLIVYGTINLFTTQSVDKAVQNSQDQLPIINQQN